jgi:uncharacterized repeat protein (TIGR03803 family)
VVYWFPGNQNGTTPSTLIQAVDGTVYGIAEAGGTFNRGTIFQLTPDGTATAVHAFTGPDGASPSTLIKADDGTFYGMTSYGGENGVGTLFQTATDGSFTVVSSFAGDPMLFAAVSRGLLQASDGSIYGTTTRGGAYGYGAIFRVTSDGTVAIVYSFSGHGADGAEPITLIQGMDGNFYGTAYYGGSRGTGSAFRMTPDGTVDTLAEFAYPPTNFIQTTDGAFYLTSGNDVFRMTADGVATRVHTFALSEGYGPAGLMQAADGNLYGTCSFGPTGYVGSLFRMTLGADVTVLHAFSQDSDGANPHAAPIQTTDRYLYGTTQNGGGPGKAGVVFRFALP